MPRAERTCLARERSPDPNCRGRLFGCNESLSTGSTEATPSTGAARTLARG